ncbi:hypothetical protein CHH78_06775 [Shouchella clausii]|uniref:hypothetical protein n=1 Tax=Shouchella clausii TaxID=79880 RepID=UPI00079B1994|nr:hypothetical protein [Shouchella clausii]PAD44279.1 hypothetical protein CHH54_02625 [Bacillus sp. 7520-S]KKI86909.1 hypothetical protein WZ76_08260 [Shouchella clausii]MBU8596202.1 hypothetical protein [Shouchella clausii]MCY1102987.1 hypothetical protein [Shouchella clausii]PAD09876.1 hypothetical protein CHH76_07220 [Shouchella clausii]
MTAGALNMELHVAKRSSLSLEGEQEELNVSFQPTKKTFDILNRWKEVNTINADVPYPAEAIEHHDWYTISDELLKAEVFINEIHIDLYKYIVNGELPEGKTIRGIAGTQENQRLDDKTESN